MTLFAITEKKAVYKPFAAPYFITSSFEVANWVNRSHLFGDPRNLNRMLNRVDCNTWELTPIPVASGDTKVGVWNDGNASVSPMFMVSPVTVYGTVDKLVLPDGTTYHNWFTPEFSVDPDLSNYTHAEFDSSKYNARVVVPMNFWHEHHLFRQWEPNPDWKGEPVSHNIGGKAR